MKSDLPQEPLSPATKPLLKNIVSQLAVSFMPLTIERRSFIVNHISPDIQLEKDENLVSHALGNLLHNIILLSKEQCIQVQSDAAGNSTLITLNCADPKFYDTLLVKNQALQQQVKKLGAQIDINLDQLKGTTISFSVSHPLEAA